MDKVRVARIACVVKMVLVGCAGHAEDVTEEAPEMEPGAPEVPVEMPAVCVLSGAYRAQHFKAGMLQVERVEFIRDVPCKLEETICVGAPPCNHIVCQPGNPSPGCTTTSGDFVIDRQLIE